MRGRGGKGENHVGKQKKKIYTYRPWGLYIINSLKGLEIERIRISFPRSLPSLVIEVVS